MSSLFNWAGRGRERSSRGGLFRLLRDGPGNQWHGITQQIRGNMTDPTIDWGRVGESLKRSFSSYIAERRRSGSLVQCHCSTANYQPVERVFGYMIHPLTSYGLFPCHTDAQVDCLVQLTRRIVASTSEPQARARALQNLGRALTIKYSKSAVPVEEYFVEARQALDQATACYNSIRDQCACWYHLGALYAARYRWTEAEEDRQEGTRFASLAYENSPKQQPTSVLSFSLLAELRKSRNKFIDAWRTFSALRSPEMRFDSKSPEVMEEMGRLLSIEYAIVASADCVDNAVVYLTEILDSVPSNDPLLYTGLCVLGDLLFARYGFHERATDYDDVIQFGEMAMSSDDNEPLVTEFLLIRTMLCNQRFRVTGDITKINEAIQLMRKKLFVDSSKGRSNPLNTFALGNCLLERYEFTNALGDLEEAIQWQRQAMREAPEHHMFAARMHFYMSETLKKQYQRTMELASLNEAIEHMRMASSSPGPHSYHPEVKLLYNCSLAELHLQKYNATNDAEHLTEALNLVHTIFEEKLSGEAAQAYGLAVDTIGSIYRTLYEKTGDSSYLLEAIATYERATNQGAKLPMSHRSRSRLLSNLTWLYLRRGEETRDLGYLSKALEYCEKILKDNNAAAAERVEAGRTYLTNIVKLQQWEAAYKAANLTASLVPQLSLRSLRHSDRKQLLANLYGLASEAAGVALRAGKSPLDALRLVEQTRGIIGASLEQLRADMSRLKDVDPELARDFAKAQQQLTAPIHQEDWSPALFDKTSSWAHRDFEERQKFDEILSRIQQTPGFENFLRPLSEAKIFEAASRGPVVVISVAPFGCDALLVTANGVRAVPLPDLSHSEVVSKAQNGDFGSYDTLEWLWMTVARPVLDALGFTQRYQDSGNGSNSMPPHIWWIPTGPLTNFPLHAAGLHRARTGQTVLDRVMSSYASSITSLIHVRERWFLLPPAPSDSTSGIDGISNQVLLVAMEETPGVARHAVLPFAAKEVEVVRQLCTFMGLSPISPGGHKQTIARYLRSCQFFHFAGHGATDPVNAENSRLLLLPDNDAPANNLDDGTPTNDGSLRVSEILDMDLTSNPTHPPPFLAYLSACGTGSMRDVRVADESIHLANAFQLAGFRHVLGTFWEVLDKMCVDVTRFVYERLLRDWKRGDLTDDSVCRALHEALRRVRDREVDEIFRGVTRSVRDVVLCEEEDVAAWAPYVHFGP